MSVRYIQGAKVSDAPKERAQQHEQKNQVKMLQNCAHGSSICKQSQGNYSLKLKNLFEDHSSGLCTQPVIIDYII